MPKFAFEVTPELVSLALKEYIKIERKTVAEAMETALKAVAEKLAEDQPMGFFEAFEPGRKFQIVNRKGKVLEETNVFVSNVEGPTYMILDGGSAYYVRLSNLVKDEFGIEGCKVKLLPRDD